MREKQCVLSTCVYIYISVRAFGGLIIFGTRTSLIDPGDLSTCANNDRLFVDLCAPSVYRYVCGTVAPLFRNGVKRKHGRPKYPNIIIAISFLRRWRSKKFSAETRASTTIGGGQYSRDERPGRRIPSTWSDWMGGRLLCYVRRLVRVGFSEQSRPTGKRSRDDRSRAIRRNTDGRERKTPVNTRVS